MCSGRVDLEFVLRAFANGMDGVFIGGCRLGECNYGTHGNYHAFNMALLGKKILEHLGVHPDRLDITFMSSGEGNLYTEQVEKFTRRIRELGPLGLGEGLDLLELKAELEAVRKLIPYIKVEKRDKLAQRVDKDTADFYTSEEVKDLFAEVATYYIDPAKCQACGICARCCPVKAIDGGKGVIHLIDQDKCIKCGSCFAACPPRFGAVQRLAGEPAPPPVPEDQRTVQKKGKEARS